MSDPRKQRSTIRGLFKLMIVTGIHFLWVMSGARLPVHCLPLCSALILLFWVVVPAGVFYGLKLAANPPIIPFDPDNENTPEFARSCIRTLVPELRDLGFSVVAHLRMQSPGSSSQNWLTLFASVPRRQTARLVTIHFPKKVLTQTMTSLAFRTDFSDGTRMITTNMGTRSSPALSLSSPCDGTRMITTNMGTPPYIPQVGIYIPQVGIRHGSIDLPQIRHAAPLHHVHEAAILRFAGDGLRTLPNLIDPPSYLRASFQQDEYENWVATGYIYLDEQQGLYRPTWKGVVLMGLKFSLPIRFLRERLRAWNASRLLRELEIADQA